MTPREDRLLKMLARQQPFSITNTLRRQWIVNGRISRRTVNRHLNSARFRARRPIKRPLLTHCFNRTMTEWLTLNRSAVCLVGHITPYHSNHLPSLCIWQFSTCHVEIKFRKFKVSPAGSPDSNHSALQTRCEADGLSTGASADGPSIDVLTAQCFMTIQMRHN
jgi:hypothetical protein